MDDKKPPIIGKLEDLRKNESNIFKDSKFRPENALKGKQPADIVKKEILEKSKTLFKEKQDNASSL